MSLPPAAQAKLPKPPHTCRSGQLPHFSVNLSRLMVQHTCRAGTLPHTCSSLHSQQATCLDHSHPLPLECTAEHVHSSMHSPPPPLSNAQPNTSNRLDFRPRLPAQLGASMLVHLPLGQVPKAHLPPPPAQPNATTTFSASASHCEVRHAHLHQLVSQLNGLGCILSSLGTGLPPLWLCCPARVHRQEGPQLGSLRCQGCRRCEGGKPALLPVQGCAPAAEGGVHIGGLQGRDEGWRRCAEHGGW